MFKITKTLRELSVARGSIYLCNKGLGDWHLKFSEQNLTPRVLPKGSFFHKIYISAQDWWNQPSAMQQVRWPFRFQSYWNTRLINGLKEHRHPYMIIQIKRNTQCFFFGLSRFWSDCLLVLLLWYPWNKVWRCSVHIVGWFVSKNTFRAN